MEYIPNLTSLIMMDIFGEIDDMAWYTCALTRNIIDEHAHMTIRIAKCDSVPYMN